MTEAFDDYEEKMAAMNQAYNLGVAAYARVGPLVASERPFRELPFTTRQAWIKAVWELKEACEEPKP